MKMRLLLPSLAMMWLAACATVSPPSPRAPPPFVQPQGPAAAAETAPPPIAVMPVPPPPAPAPVDVWDQLRSSFVMDDCQATPAVIAQAKRYTRYPERFEGQLRAVLPRLAYVQQVADEYGVAGEFALLPWVESHFRPVPAHKHHRSAGMWQIMPVTAGAMGLQVDGHYDGRLDVPASTRAVMKLLRRYHDEFQDWRVADYAYNKGEFSVKRLIRKHGMPPDKPVIPAWPVREVTRTHLTKLLAIACIVRRPERFHVSLPDMQPARQLVSIKIPHSMPVAKAADHAGMTVQALKNLNAAFRSDIIDADAASYLLLPASHAQQFRDALLDQSASRSADRRPDSGVAMRLQEPDIASSSATHTVRSGDSLWQIARKYSVGVKQLQQWNHLSGQKIKPGQVLKVSRAD